MRCRGTELAHALLNEAPMVVSALVVMLSPDPEVAAGARERLASDARITVGEPVRDRLPVVIETMSSDESATLVESLTGMDGVVRVDVVAIDFGEEAA